MNCNFFQPFALKETTSLLKDNIANLKKKVPTTLDRHVITLCKISLQVLHANAVWSNYSQLQATVG